jgi:transcriptional regulator with XRE-family HTH domain
MTRNLPRESLDAFARRLRAAMNKKGFSDSDLARLVWGETEDNKGYKVARNRDRIGVYLKGKGFPKPKTLAAISEHLGLTTEELAPEIMEGPKDHERPLFKATPVKSGESVHVQVNALLSREVAAKISALVLGDNAPQGNGTD